MSDHPPKTIEPFVGPIDAPEVPLEVTVTGEVRTVAGGQRRFQTGQAVISTGAETVQVFGADRQRAAGVIVNTSSQVVTLLASRQDGVSNGFALQAGASLSIGHQGAVFAICPTATAAGQAVVAYALEIGI